MLIKYLNLESIHVNITIHVHTSTPVLLGVSFLASFLIEIFGPYLAL